MPNDKNDRLAGMVLGSLVADSLALGAHWIYDQAELKETFGRVTDFRKPLADSYHPRKEAGEQTHYGDQTLVLLASISALGHYDEADFFQKWRALWIGYPDYLDHATKETLANLEKGAAIGEAASDSEELGGAARLAPMLAVLSDEALETRIAVARRHVSLTHDSPIAIDAAEFLTRLTGGVLEGQEIAAAVDQAASAHYAALPMRKLLQKVSETQSLETKAAVAALGLACPAIQAIPSVLALLARYPEDLETAFIENVMAGGDSAARGLALGQVLGAHLGKSAIPKRWLDGLRFRLPDSFPQFSRSEAAGK